MCVWGIINTRNSSSYDIRLSIYIDGVRPVEIKWRLEVEEKLVRTAYTQKEMTSKTEFVFKNERFEDKMTKY